MERGKIWTKGASIAAVGLAGLMLAQGQAHGFPSEIDNLRNPDSDEPFPTGNGDFGQSFNTSFASPPGDGPASGTIDLTSMTMEAFAFDAPLSDAFDARGTNSDGSEVYLNIYNDFQSFENNPGSDAFSGFVDSSTNAVDWRVVNEDGAGTTEFTWDFNNVSLDWDREFAAVLSATPNAGDNVSARLWAGTPDFEGGRPFFAGDSGETGDDGSFLAEFDVDVDFFATVDRDTGEIEIENSSGNSIELAGYEVNSENGALDEGDWQAIADSNGDFTRFTEAGASDNLAEGSADSSITLADNESISLGTSSWLKGPVANEEGFSVDLLLGDNSIREDLAVLFEGNNGEPFPFGDLDFDGDVDADDWVELRDVLLNETDTSLSDAQLYQEADLDADGDIDRDDFNAFKDAFLAANPDVSPGSVPFAVPEPATLTMLGFGGLAFMRRRRRA